MITIKDFGEHVCGPRMLVREVLARIDTSQYLFQIVMDDDGRLLGTITDGDIRRAMLHGIGLDDTAEKCMQPNPKTGVLGGVVQNRDLMANLGSTRAFLPILDDAGLVREILVAVAGPGIGCAIVMAGGEGRRLGEKTRSTPKPLLPIGDRPILEHVLSSLETAGVAQIFVTVHYLGEQIEQYLANRDSRAKIDVVWEPAPLGTAGALGILDGRAPREPMLVVNGDIVTGVDFAALHEFHTRHGFDGTAAVTRFDVDIPFGVIRYGEDGLFESIEEKPKISSFVAAGVYYLSPEYLPLVPQGQPMDMPDLLNTGKEIGLQTGLFPIHEYWTDVGRPADLEAAQNRHRLKAAGTGTG
jgi:dTDP-glucose pyrophosphorylase